LEVEKVVKKAEKPRIQREQHCVWQQQHIDKQRPLSSGMEANNLTEVEPESLLAAWSMIT
jgi:hypothetical protein